jgi:paraquat-inducible protein B
LNNSRVEVDPHALEIVLRTRRVGSLRANAPVYYRGVGVGTVQGIQLDSSATAVDVRVAIRPKYAPLVRTNSRFWNVSGAKVHFGLLSGLQVNVQSLSSLVAGGIAFATPGNTLSKVARNGTQFPLYDAPDKEWLTWAPKIALLEEN